MTPQTPDDSKITLIMSRLRVFGVLLAAVMLFIIPQIVAAVIVIIVGMLMGESSDFIEDASISVNFIVYGLAEALTLVALYVAMLVFGISWGDIGVNKKGLSKFWMVIPAFVVYIPLTLIALTVAGLLLPSDVIEAEQDLGFDEIQHLWEYAIAFVSLVILAPIAEELVFRGFLFRQLRVSWPFWASALLSAGIFGLAHMQINVGLDVFMLALPLAYLVEKTKSIYASIGLHMLKNFIAYALLFLLPLLALS